MNAGRTSNVSPGSRSASRSQLLCTGFLNPDGSVVTVVLNLSNTVVKYKLVSEETSVDASIPARAIQTAVF